MLPRGETITSPARYGVAGRCYTVRAAHANAHLPRKLAPETTYLAVSASLQWGPFGADGLFRPLDGIEPVGFTDDTTIAIYRTADLPVCDPILGISPLRQSTRR